MGRGAALAVLVLVPFLLAAADPRGDTGPCGGGAGPQDEQIDLVSARGEIVEDGDAIRWALTFARQLHVPDIEGHPFRVDVVIHDPTVPVVSFRYYHDLNRIVRFDAVPQPLLQIILIPEHGANVFQGATVRGNTLAIEVPGRIVVQDQDLAGLGLGRLRWSVIARDEGTCDLLGDGRPTHRLTKVPPEPVPTFPPPVQPPATGRGFSTGLRAALIAGAVLVLGIAVGSLAAVRRRGGRSLSP